MGIVNEQYVVCIEFCVCVGRVFYSKVHLLRAGLAKSGVACRMLLTVIVGWYLHYYLYAFPDISCGRMHSHSSPSLVFLTFHSFCYFFFFFTRPCWYQANRVDSRSWRNCIIPRGVISTCFIPLLWKLCFPWQMPAITVREIYSDYYVLL